MKLTFDRNKIIEAVTPTMCAASNKNTISAIEGILFDARPDGNCTITTYDMEKGVRTTVEAKVDREGCYIINAQKFYSIIRSMDGEDVTLSVDDKLIATIESGRSSFTLHALAGADFPTIPVLEGEQGFVMSQNVLRKMICMVQHAIAVNDQRIVLNGCLFDINGSTITLVACDSYKLAKCFKTVDIENKNADGSPLSLHFIIPGKTLTELVRLLSGNDEDKVCIYLTKKHIIFVIGSVYFFSRLIDSEYIDYERIIPKNQKYRANINTAQFLAALDRASLVTEDKIAGAVRSHVKLDFNKDKLEISSISANGQVFEPIGIDYDGEELIMGFNNKYLSDTVRAIEDEMIKISMSSPIMSINIEPYEEKEGEGYLYMVLPLRLKD